MSARHQTELARVNSEKENLEQERRSFEIRLYEKSSECDLLKEELRIARASKEVFEKESTLE